MLNMVVREKKRQGDTRFSVSRRFYCILIIAFAVFVLFFVELSIPSQRSLFQCPSQERLYSSVQASVQAIVSAVGTDKTSFVRLFRDNGAGFLVNSMEGSTSEGYHSEGHLSPPRSPLRPPVSDERSIYGFHNFLAQWPNEQLGHRRAPCATWNATRLNREGTDVLTKFVEEGYKALPLPPDDRTLLLPEHPRARALFDAAVAEDPLCVPALLNAGTVRVLGYGSESRWQAHDRTYKTEASDEADWQSVAESMLRRVISVPHAQTMDVAKAWMMLGILKERMNRNPFEEFGQVRRIYPKYCLQYFAYKCDAKVSPSPMIWDMWTRNTAGRQAEMEATLRLLLATEYQSLALGGTTNLTATDALQFSPNMRVVLRNLLSGYALQMVQFGWLMLVETDALKFGDPQVPLRFGHGNDAMSALMRGHLTELVSRLAGAPVKPSYSYFGGYRTGAVLPPHTDRLACEFTLSLHLYIDPSTPWPFLFDERPITIEPEERGGARPRPPEDRVVNVTLWPGDAGLIRGRRVIHFRDKFEGRLAMQLFHHFVWDDFPEDNFGK